MYLRRWPSSASGDYKPINASLQLADADDDEGPPPTPPTRGFRDLLLCFVCVFCTVINIYAALNTPSANGESVAATSLRSLSRKDISRLRRPSTFIGFDSIHRPSPPIPKQINTFPVILTQIDKTNPKVFDDNTARYLSTNGTVAVEKRRISTIMQFRAIDWGMEQCSLQLIVPPLADASIIPPGRSFTLSLYRLNATHTIDGQSLSHSSRPSRVAKLADIHVASGEATNFQRNSSCMRDELMTFELACSRDTHDNDCMLQWWQDKENPTPGALGPRRDAQAVDIRRSSEFHRYLYHSTLNRLSAGLRWSRRKECFFWVVYCVANYESVRLPPVLLHRRVRLPN
ncbi:hypothetical protein BC834DRAFT_835798 [Gloeopeniophorella convolvens]|nr:hypothetical protein BC834DRAFT_835798 [Gloeopeniophorella convolvens]